MLNFDQILLFYIIATSKQASITQNQKVRRIKLDSYHQSVQKKFTGWQ